MADQRASGISVAFPGRQVVQDDNPFARFASAPIAMENPFSRFKAGPADSYGDVSFTRPIENVRADLYRLPPEERQRALDAWGDYYVANEAATKSRPQSILSTINDYLEAVARGTPIGSWGDEIDGALKDTAYRITGGAIGAPREEAQAYTRARQRAFDRANPWTSGGLQVAGALASAPFAPTLRVAQGGSMLGRMGNAAATGAAYGSVYGAGLGDDTMQGRASEALKGAAIGSALGAAAAPIATAGANAVKYVADKYRGIPHALEGFERGAIDRVARAMADDGLFAGGQASPPVPGGYARLAKELGPEGMLADMGANLRSQAQGIASQPSRGQSIMIGALDARHAGAPHRIAADTDAVLGPARNLVRLEDATVAATKSAAAPFYDAFYASQIPVSQQLVGLLQRVPEAAWAKVRQLSQAEGVDLAQTINTGRGIDLIKRGLDDMARAAGRGTNEERIYSNLARAIRDEVDSLLSPGSPASSVWAQARRHAGDGLQFREGLNEGRLAFARSTHPDQMRADLSGMDPFQREAYREGARGQIRDIMGSASTNQGENAASAARRALGSEYARDKLRIVTSTPPNAVSTWRAPADRLIDRLDAETAFANTRAAAYLGSQTAARTAAQKEFPNAASRREVADRLGGKSAAGLGLEYGYRAINALLGGAVDARNARISADAARLLSEYGVQRDALARALMDYGQGRSVTTRGRDALTRLNQILLDSGRPGLINAADATGDAHRQ